MPHTATNARTENHRHRKRYSTAIWVSTEIKDKVKSLAKSKGQLVQWTADELLRDALARKHPQHPPTEIA